MKALAILAGAALLAAGATQADATIYLGMSYNGGAISTLADDGGTGNLTYAASLFGFTNSVVVQGYPTLDQPALQTASINSQRSSGLAGFLTIYVTQTDLNPITGSLLSSFTSNTFMGSAQSVELSTYLDRNNGLFGGDLLASQSFSGQGSESYVSSLSGLTGKFSETTKYVIRVGNGAASLNDTINISSGAVPEPATWAMMLAGFGFIGAALRQRRRATVSYG